MFRRGAPCSQVSHVYKLHIVRDVESPTEDPRSLKLAEVTKEWNANWFIRGDPLAAPDRTGLPRLRPESGHRGSCAGWSPASLCTPAGHGRRCAGAFRPCGAESRLAPGV